MSSIIPVSTTRVSDLLIRERLMRQLQLDQADLLRIQQQISTGRRVLAPSEDPQASVRAIALQSLLERKAQVETNLQTSQSFLAATDSGLANVSQQLTEIRGEALGVAGTISSDTQRQAVVARIDAVLSQLVDVGNQQFRGRYLFAGSSTTVQPFRSNNQTIEYLGNTGKLKSYADVDLLFDTNVTGDEVFGAISAASGSTVDLNPILRAETRLSSLRGGRGIAAGSVSISDGFDTQIIDLSRAETIGDVARLIEANPPLGKTVTVDVTATGLELRLHGAGTLVVQEVAGGTTAKQLGILQQLGANPLVGGDLNPQLTKTTLLADAFGVRAKAELVSAGANDDVVLEAKTRGAALNGISVVYASGGTAGAETASLVGNTLTITIEDGVSTAAQVVQAINNTAGLPFTASLGPHDAGNTGTGAVSATATAVTAGGSGVEFDQTSGLYIKNGNESHQISLAAANTVEDLLNILNGAGAGLQAEINAAGTGIDIRSRLSGADFSIGENGGSTASQLGVRTFTRETRLEDLNYGRGVRDAEGGDFTIRRTDGEVLEIELAGAVTVGDVLDRINAASQAVPGAHVTARLAVTGNGIELVSDDAAPLETLEVRRTALGAGAIDLGLIAEGQEASATAVAAGTTFTLTGADVNPQETEGVFNALLRLRQALVANDQTAIQRAVGLIDQANTDLNFTRGDLAARQQTLDVLQSRLAQEKIDLTATLSLEIDVDLTSAISELAGRQASFEAALRMAAQALQLSLFDFL